METADFSKLVSIKNLMIKMYCAVHYIILWLFIMYKGNCGTEHC